MSFLSNLESKFNFLIFTLFTVVFNYFATTLPLNNLSTADVSDKYFTILTPSGFTFIVWGLIYTCQIVLGILIVFNKIKLSITVTRLYTLSCFLNCLWLVSWHYLSLPFSAFLLLTLCVINYLTFVCNYNTKNYIKNKYVEFTLLIYFAWSLVASVINITSFLKYFLGINSIFYISQYLTASLVLTLGLGLIIYVSKKFNNVSPLLIFLWALIGIRGANNDSNYLTLLTIIIVANIMALLYTIIPNLNHKMK
jgi:translocator protein